MKKTVIGTCIGFVMGVFLFILVFMFVDNYSFVDKDSTFPATSDSKVTNNSGVPVQSAATHTGGTNATKTKSTSVILSAHAIADMKNSIKNSYKPGQKITKGKIYSSEVKEIKVGDEIRKLLIEIESVSNETVIDLDTYQGGNVFAFGTPKAKETDNPLGVQKIILKSNDKRTYKLLPRYTGLETTTTSQKPKLLFGKQDGNNYEITLGLVTPESEVYQYLEVTDSNGKTKNYYFDVLFKEYINNKISVNYNSYYTGTSNFSVYNSHGSIQSFKNAAKGVFDVYIPTTIGTEAEVEYSSGIKFYYTVK